MKIKKRTVVISSCLLAAAIMTISMRFVNPQGFLIANSANDSHTVWGHYNRLEPTLDTPGCQEFWISCDDHEIKYVAPTTGVIQDRGTPTVAQIEEWKAKEIPQDRRYLPKWRIDETHISFGSYPTTKITDSTTTNVLTSKLSVTAPTASNHAGWEVYDYYVSNTLRNGNNGIGFYQDIFVNGKYFRAVYFRSLRPFGTHTTADQNNSQVDNNGYSIQTLYFFEFTPLEWTIIEEDSSSIKMVSNLVLDSFQFDHSTSVASYAVSDMHSFLTSTFFNDAFVYAQESMLQIDGSEKITILDLDEARALSSNEDKNAATSERTFVSSDYAKSQGNYVSGGYGDWALKTLASSGNRYTVAATGAIESNRSVRLTHRSGIVPVIALSK